MVHSIFLLSLMSCFEKKPEDSNAVLSTDGLNPTETDQDGDGHEDDQDCDDENPEVNPGAEEIPYDGIDNDCDPATPDNDLDNDGFDLNEDCDDENPDINSNSSEIPYDGIDNDCDPATPDNDLDNDGFDLDEDCDDLNAAVNPEGSDDNCNGVDEDCDGVEDEDWTGDTYEPNDDPFAPVDMGELLENQEILLSSHISHPDDKDHYMAYVDDGWGPDFGININLTVPSDMDLAMELLLLEHQTYTPLKASNDGGLGGNESIEYGGGTFGSDSGQYVILIYSLHGSSCQNAYELSIEEGGLW